MRQKDYVYNLFLYSHEVLVKQLGIYVGYSIDGYEHSLCSKSYARYYRTYKSLKSSDRFQIISS